MPLTEGTPDLQVVPEEELEFPNPPRLIFGEEPPTHEIDPDLENMPAMVGIPRSNIILEHRKFLHPLDPPALRFGTELEVLVIPSQICSSRESAGDYLSSILTSKNEYNEIDRDRNLAYSFERWTIVYDSSLFKYEDKDANLWGLEIVSAINTEHYGSKGPWEERYQTLWTCLEENLRFVKSSACGTHVHISAESSWLIAGITLKSVAKAVVYFERCVDSLMPEDRRNNRYCGSNRNNPLLQSRSFPEIFELIEGCETLAELSKLMCSDGMDSSNKFFRWNFTPLGRSMGTIEFRQPPGCTNAEDAVTWTEFALAFVKGAEDYVKVLELIDPKETPRLAQLLSMITISSPKNSDLWWRLFAGKEQLPEARLDGNTAQKVDLGQVREMEMSGQDSSEKFHRGCMEYDERHRLDLSDNLGYNLAGITGADA